MILIINYYLLIITRNKRTMTDHMSISESEIQMNDKPEFDIPRNKNYRFKVYHMYIICTCV